MPIQAERRTQYQRWKRDLLVAGVLLLFGACSIFAVSRGLDINAIHRAVAALDHAHHQHRTKPPLNPPPEPLLDLQGFQYIINVDPCDTGNITAVILVHSHFNHVEVRSAFRRAYPEAELRRLNMRRVFLVAVTDTNGTEQRALADEAKRFHDIVQGNFHEAYRNLTYKHTMGLRWAYRYCPEVRFIIKMDDDIVANFYHLNSHLQNTPPQAHNALYGFIMKDLSPQRDPRQKWFVTREEYPDEKYPTYVSGWLYVTSPALARAQVTGALRRPYFWVDDVVLTGLVPADMPPERQPAFHDLSPLFTTDASVIRCCIAQPQFLCDVDVGPNGGEEDLVVRFHEHAARCHYDHTCKQRPPANFCGSKTRAPDLLHGGHGQAKAVPLF